MPWSGYTGSERKLAQVAENYFNRIRENPSIKKGEQIDSKLSWKPSLHFQGFKHETIAVEASETPYPAILKTIHADIINVQIPIVVYCICPEDAFLLKSNQVDIKNLENHGYGLLTVNDAGEVKRRHACITLIQHIP